MAAHHNPVQSGSFALADKKPAAAPTGLAARIPAGLRAITLQTTDEIAVGGLVRPGDRVDVQLVLRDDMPGIGAAAHAQARTLLQDVQILAVGTAMAAAASHSGAPTGPGNAARTITLALTPADVSLFTLARSLGSLYLALRNPADSARPRLARVLPAHVRGSGQSAGSGARAPQRPRHGQPIQLVTAGQSRLIYTGGR